MAPVHLKTSQDLESEASTLLVCKQMSSEADDPQRYCKMQLKCKAGATAADAPKMQEKRDNVGLEENPELPWVFDARIGREWTNGHKLSLVISNLTNAEYSIRPLSMEAPRLTSLMYTYQID